MFRFIKKTIEKPLKCKNAESNRSKCRALACGGNIAENELLVASAFQVKNKYYFFTMKSMVGRRHCDVLWSCFFLLGLA